MSNEWGAEQQLDREEGVGVRAQKVREQSQRTDIRESPLPFFPLTLSPFTPYHLAFGGLPVSVQSFLDAGQVVPAVTERVIFDHELRSHRCAEA